jgi:hypothetical protein
VHHGQTARSHWLALAEQTRSLASAAGLPGTAELIETLERRHADTATTICVVGLAKTGKSALVNHLLGSEVAPQSDGYGVGTPMLLTADPAGAPDVGVDLVVQPVDSAWLRAAGIVLIDTPGLADGLLSPAEQQDRLTAVERIVARCDITIVTTTAVRALDRLERDLITRLTQTYHVPDLLVALTMIEHVSDPGAVQERVLATLGRMSRRISLLVLPAPADPPEVSRRLLRNRLTATADRAGSPPGRTTQLHRVLVDAGAAIRDRCADVTAQRDRPRPADVTDRIALLGRQADYLRRELVTVRAAGLGDGLADDLGVRLRKVAREGHARILASAQLADYFRTVLPDLIDGAVDDFIVAARAAVSEALEADRAWADALVRDTVGPWASADGDGDDARTRRPVLVTPDGVAADAQLTARFRQMDRRGRLATMAYLLPFAAIEIVPRGDKLVAAPKAALDQITREASAQHRNHLARQESDRIVAEVSERVAATVRERVEASYRALADVFTDRLRRVREIAEHGGADDRGRDQWLARASAAADLLARLEVFALTTGTTRQAGTHAERSQSA